MLKALRDSGRLNITLLLFLMSLFSFGLSILRCVITGSNLFLFLNWNLFLAIIPWFLSSCFIIKKVNNKISMLSLALVWIAFFPNSPYILTDLFHLHWDNHKGLIWFDLILILSFAWTGLFFGFISLLDIHKMLTKYLKEKWIYLITIFFLFLSSFGIYLGRFLRWNSWDIIQQPHGLFNDIADRFVDPFSHPRTWGMTILLGLLLNLMYFSLRFLSSNQSIASIKK